MATKHIVILERIWRASSCQNLHKYIKKRDDVKISLIDQNDYHTLLTELHEVAGYGIEPHGVKVSIEHVLEYTKVDFIKDRIIGADLKEKSFTRRRPNIILIISLSGLAVSRPISI